MALFLISYDLIKPDKNYDDVLALLKNWGAKKVLLSAWAIKGNFTAQGIKDSMTKPQGPIDADDRLVVVKFDGWSNHNPLTKMQDL
jgi:hypothetical protein